MRNDKGIIEKIFSAIVMVLWLLIWKPISIVFKYIWRLFREVMAGIHKNLVKWLSVVGLLAVLSLFAYLFHIPK